MSTKTANRRQKRRIKATDPTVYWLAFSDIGAGMFCDIESGCPALFSSPKQAFELAGPFTRAIPITIQRTDKLEVKWTDFVRADSEPAA